MSIKKQPKKKPRASRVKKPKAVVNPCNEGYGNCWQCRDCRATMKAAVESAKPVRAWGLVTATGRLLNETTRHRRDWDVPRGPGETVIPVRIVPIL